MPATSERCQPCTDQSMLDRGRHLYIIECSAAPGLLKIGRSNDPWKRAVSLQAGTCFWMNVKATFSDAGPLERTVHYTLRHRRVTDIPGTEWFRLSYIEALEAITSVLKDDQEGASAPDKHALMA